jgi:hypothetical protein
MTSLIQGVFYKAARSLPIAFAGAYRRGGRESLANTGLSWFVKVCLMYHPLYLHGSKDDSRKNTQLRGHYTYFAIQA